MRLLKQHGLSHSELAARTGIARETLSRWTTGANRPSLEALEAVVDAAGLQLDITLIAAEPKLIALAHDQLDLSPIDRVRTLLDEDWLACQDALRAAASTGLAVLVGPVAAALQGAPQRPGHGRVDLLVPDADHEQAVEDLLDADVHPDGFENAGGGHERRERWRSGRGALTLRTTATGLDDTALLRDRGHRASVNRDQSVTVARPEDLLRISQSSPWSEDAVYRSGLRAVLASGRYSARQPHATPVLPA